MDKGLKSGTRFTWNWFPSLACSCTLSCFIWWFQSRRATRLSNFWQFRFAYELQPTILKIYKHCAHSIFLHRLSLPSKASSLRFLLRSYYSTSSPLWDNRLGHLWLQALSANKSLVTPPLGLQNRTSCLRRHLQSMTRIPLTAGRM